MGNKAPSFQATGYTLQISSHCAKGKTNNINYILIIKEKCWRLFAGKRKTMEDADIIQLKFAKRRDQAFFGIFDGHYVCW